VSEEFLLPKPRAMKVVVFPVTTLSGISAAHSITSIALLSAQSCTAHPVELSFQ